MILDTVHLLYEAGFDVLPNNINPLKQGWVRPPNAMDGIPAPLSITVNPEDTIISKVSIYVGTNPHSPHMFRRACLPIIIIC